MAHLKLTAAKPSRSTLQRRSISWWSRKTHCLSQFGPNGSKCIKPSYRISKLLKSPKILQDRPASYWGRPGFPWRFYETEDKPDQDKKPGKKDEVDEEDPFELTAAERAWRQRMKAWKKYLDEDPSDAIFGRSNDMLRGLGWSIPRWMREEMGLKDLEPETPRRKVEESKAGVPDSSAKPSTPNGNQQAGISPKASGNSQSVFYYDPISGKMVPKQSNRPTQTSTTKARPDNDGWIDIPVKPFRPQSTQPTSIPKKDTDTITTKESTPREKSIEPAAPSPLPPRPFNLFTDVSIHDFSPQPVDPVREALKEYEQREQQKQSKPPVPLQGVVDRVAMPDPVKLSSSSKAQPRRPYLPADDIDLLRPSDVRASMGISKHPKKETEEQKMEQREILEKEFEKAHEETDVQPEPADAMMNPRLSVLESLRQKLRELDRRIEKLEIIEKGEMKGLEGEPTKQKQMLTEFESQSNLVKDMVQQSAQMLKGLDGKLRTKGILETSLQRHAAKGRNARRKTIEAAAKQEDRTVDHNSAQQYSEAKETEPTMPPSSKTALSGLSEDVNAASKVAKPPVDAWGYSTIPQGLETSYAEEVERKKHGIKSPEELKREQEAEAVAQAADPYDKTPQGLETSYQREMERKAMGIKTAYEERMEKEAAEIAKAADPYDKTPQGLESSFAREKAAGRSLENEIQAREIAANEMADCFDTGRSLPETKAKTGMSVAAEDPVDAYGYSLKPMGLQTSFEREKAAGQSLEDEIKAQTANAMNDGYDTGRSLPETIKAKTGVSVTVEDPVDAYGYSLKPMGLQRSFEREKAAGRKLEEEIKAQKNAMTAWEDRFSHDYSDGLETSFARERADVANGKRKSLEQEMKEMNSLSSTAAEEAESRRLSERRAAEEAAKKAQKERDVELVREVRKIYEDHYGTIHTKHQQGSPVAAELEGRVDEGVHSVLKEFEAQTNKDYNFTPDDLEAELASQNQPAAKPQSSLESSGALQPQPQLSISPAATADATSPLASPSQPQALEQAPTKITEPAPSPLPQSATYKILAYDIHSSSVAATTTFSTPPAEEKPLPLTVSLSGLNYPALFLPHLPGLAREGFVPVSATPDLLVFRKFANNEKASTAQGTAAPAQTGFILTSDPAENSAALDELDAPDVQEPRRNMNPVDGTTTTLPTPTGNFASPTGFVNHDPISADAAVPAPPLPAHPSAPGATASRDPALNLNSASFLSSVHEDPSAGARGPRVRRTEPVFSGGGRKWKNGKKGKKEGGTVRRVAVSAIWAAACCYVVGVVAEVVKLGG